MDNTKLHVENVLNDLYLFVILLTAFLFSIKQAFVIAVLTGLVLLIV